MSLNDVYLTANEGDEYTFGGLFYHGESEKLLLFNTISVKWSQGEWVTTKLGLTDSGVLHDINADKELNLWDLIRAKKYFGAELAAVNEMQMDINFSKSIDEGDVHSLRKILIDGICYDKKDMYMVSRVTRSRRMLSLLKMRVLTCKRVIRKNGKATKDWNL